MNIREIRAVSLLQPASALLLPLLLPLLFPALAFPADRDSIWKGGVNEYVKYADQDSSDFGRNDHPVVLRPDQIKTVLGYLRIQGKDDAASYEELDPVFTAEQVEALGKSLAKGLQSAAPDQDIVFALEKSVKRGPVLKPARYFVAGRAFYKGSDLNIIIGDYNRLRDEGYEAAVDPTKVGFVRYSFDFGSRTKRSKDFDKSLVYLDGIETRQIDGAQRSDWLVIDVDTAMVAYDQRAASRRNAELEKKRQELREILGEEAVPPRQPAAAPVAAPIAAPAPTKRGISWKELEEGLTTLHRLRERGLITDADYEAKKKEMLDALGNW